MTRQLTPIGFLPKRKVQPPYWLKVDNLIEICSVTPCLDNQPKGILSRWVHNDFGMFDSEALALDAIPDGQDPAEFEIHALRLFPVAFEDGEELELELPPLTIAEPPEGYRRLGFDAAGFFFKPSPGIMPSFRHSPLYCNRMAQEIAVNHYCLLDEAETALALARRFSVEKPEPGMYIAVEVLRG